MKKVLFTATVDSHILCFHIPFLKLFKDMGYEVHVATNGNGEIPYCDKKIFIPFERSPYKLNNLKAIKKLKKVIMEEKYDIIHTHTPMGAVVTRLAAKKARKKYHTRVIYTAHGFHFYKGAPLLNWMLFYPVEKYLSKYTDTLITINKEDYERAKHKFCKRCKDIQYVPGVGIDEEKFSVELDKNQKKKLKNSLGLKDDDFVLTYVARLDKNKNQGFLIEVMKKLVCDYPNIHLLLVGPDELNGEYQKQAKDILSNVHFLGLRKDVPQLLNITDISVSSSLREGLPVNILEAMTMGVPVVATDTRGVRDLVEDNKNGFVVYNQNYEEFINQIIKLYKNHNLKQNFMIQNKKKSKNYQLGKIKEDISKIYFRKKRVLHLLASNKFSGAENVVCTIINNCPDMYEMVYCSLKGPIENTLKEKKIKYYGLDNFNYFDIKKIVNEFHPDVIHAHDNKATVLASFFSSKAKIVSHIHGNNKIMNSFNLKIFLFNITSKKISSFIWVSDSSLNGYYFKDKVFNKSKVLYNVVDKNLIIKKSKEYVCYDKYDLIFLGRIGYPKNPIRLVEIIEMLKMKMSDIRVAIVGDGPEKDKIENLIKHKNLMSNVKLYGFQSNPYPILNNSKILIMTSIYEGTPMCALEAQALGKIIVATPVDGLKKIVFNDYNGYLSDDNHILCEKIYSILNNKKLMNTMKKNTLDFFNENVSLEKYIIEITNMYEVIM